MIARRAHNPKVAGSSPAPATSTREESSSIEIGGDFLFYTLHLCFKFRPPAPITFIPYKVANA